MKVEGAVVTILGALDAFPRRLAAKEIGARGGTLRRGLSRRTDIAVVGHRMAGTADPARITARLEQAHALGATVISENTLLRLLGLACRPAEGRDLTLATLAEHSGLDRSTLDLLALFDCFDFAAEPFGFRDLVAARQYGRLIGEGVDWLALVRAVRSHGRALDGRISEMRLERGDWNSVVMRSGGAVTELDGQHLLPLESDEEARDADALFEEAEAAEQSRDWGRAAALYRRCMALDPGDPTIPFNLSHVLRRQGDWHEARICLNRVLKIDPRYAEAWYNLAALAREHGDVAATRRNLRAAIAADPGFPDPVYNLALLEFDAGDHVEAARLWARYVELDPDSAWAHKARQGLKLITIMANEGEGGAAPEAPAGESRGLRSV